MRILDRYRRRGEHQRLPDVSTAGVTAIANLNSLDTDLRRRKAILKDLEMEKALLFKHLRMMMGFSFGGVVLFTSLNAPALVPAFYNYLASGDFYDEFGRCVLGMTDNSTIIQFTESGGFIGLVVNDAINYESMKKFGAIVILGIPKLANKFPTRTYLWPKAVLSLVLGAFSTFTATLPAYMNIDFENSSIAPSWYSPALARGVAGFTFGYIAAQLVRVVVTKFFGPDKRLNTTRTALAENLAEALLTVDAQQVRRYIRITNKDYLSEAKYGTVVNIGLYLAAIGIIGAYNYANVLGTLEDGVKLWGDNAFNIFAGVDAGIWKGIFLAGPIVEVSKYIYNSYQQKKAINDQNLQDIHELFKKAQIHWSTKLVVLTSTLLIAGYSMGSAAVIVRRYWENDPVCAEAGAWEAVGKSLFIATLGALGVNWRDVANLGSEFAQNTSDQVQLWRGFLGICAKAMSKDEIHDLLLVKLINCLLNASDFTIARVIKNVTVQPQEDDHPMIQSAATVQANFDLEAQDDEDGLAPNQIEIQHQEPNPDEIRWFHHISPWGYPQTTTLYRITLNADASEMVHQLDHGFIN